MHSTQKKNYVHCTVKNNVVLYSRVEFEYMMSRLPVYVSEDDISEMFSVADRDQDGRISYNEFLVNDCLHEFDK